MFAGPYCKWSEWYVDDSALQIYDSHVFVIVAIREDKSDNRSEFGRIDRCLSSSDHSSRLFEDSGQQRSSDIMIIALPWVAYIVHRKSWIWLACLAALLCWYPRVPAPSKWALNAILPEQINISHKLAASLVIHPRAPQMILVFNPLSKAEIEWTESASKGRTQWKQLTELSWLNFAVLALSEIKSHWSRRSAWLIAFPPHARKNSLPGPSNNCSVISVWFEIT